MSHYIHARSTTPSATRCVIYCRVSSTGQEDNSSLQTQEQDCRAYASERGWTVVAVHKEVHTGRDLFERPQLTLVRESMRNQEFDVLLVWALDRLSRKQTHQGLVLTEAEHAGVEWDSATEDIDNSPQGQILRAVIGGMAEMERAKIVERTRRGIQARAQSGKILPGARPLFGYRWVGEDKGAYAIDRAKADIVQRIYTDFLNGRSLRSICLGLTNDGVPTPTGRLVLWSTPTVSDILKNPTYAGIANAFRYQTERVKGRSKRVTVRADTEQMPLPEGTIPPIVSKDVHEAAVAKLERNRVTSTRNNKSPEATLLRSGFIKCGYCGNAMSARNACPEQHKAAIYRCIGPNRDRYGCPPVTINAGQLDAQVWSRVCDVLLNPEIISAEVARRRSDQDSQFDLKAIDQRIATLDRQRKNLVRSLALLDEDEESASLIASELTSLTSQRNELNADRRAKVAQNTDSEQEHRRLTDLVSWCSRASTNLDRLTYQERRSVLEALGVQVRVWMMNHDPRWELEMAPLPIGSNPSIVFGTVPD